MRNVSTLVEFVDEFTGKTLFGINFTGIVCDEHIYAKRTTPSECQDSINFIKFPINKAHQASTARSNGWNVPHFIISVDDELGFYDHKLNRLDETKIPKNIFVAIEAAVNEEASSLKALSKN